MLLERVDVGGWFFEALQSLEGDPDVRAYVAGVLANYARGNVDPVKGSIVLELVSARMTCDFGALQRVGDWTLWTGIVFPEAFESIHVDCGRSAYSSCHRLVGGKWPVYEQLSDELPIVIDAACRGFRDNCVVVPRV